MSSFPVATPEHRPNPTNGKGQWNSLVGKSDQGRSCVLCPPVSKIRANNMRVLHKTVRFKTECWACNLSCPCIFSSIPRTFQITFLSMVCPGKSRTAWSPLAEILTNFRGWSILCPIQRVPWLGETFQKTRLRGPHSNYRHQQNPGV